MTRLDLLYSAGFALVGSFAVACGGEVRGNTGSSGVSSGGDGGLPQTSFSSAAVQAAQNTCASGGQPPPASPATTVGALRAQIVGAWWLCVDSPTAPPSNATPIVITEDGRWIDLVSDGNGGLVLGTAASEQSTYAIETVYGGQTIVDGGPGQLLGTTTTVVVTAEDGGQTQLTVDPRQGQLWVGYAAPDANDGDWAYVQLAGP